MESSEKTLKIKIIKTKSFANDGQRYPTPKETDSLYIFYTSLLKQNPKSQMALRWCLEHGLIPKKRIPQTIALLNPTCKPKKTSKQLEAKLKALQL
jgi:hypothetical protein